MGKEKLQRKLTFREAVKATPDVATGYQEGVNAFGKYADNLNSATHIVRNKFKILSNNILPSILPCQKIHLT